LGRIFRQADIYSLFVIMAKMSTGQRPFYGKEFGIILAVEISKVRD
jgi:serine/threonine protein kinase